MMSLLERPDEDEEDEVLLSSALLSVPLPPLLVLLDGELDDPVRAVVTALLVIDREFDATDCAAVGAESATCPTTTVEVAVGVPGSIVPAPETWLQVSNIAAIAPL